LHVIECKVNHVRCLFHTSPIKLQTLTIFIFKLQHVTCTILQCANINFSFSSCIPFKSAHNMATFGYQTSITHGCHYKSMEF
jgi:hypothetical protein